MASTSNTIDLIHLFPMLLTSQSEEFIKEIKSAIVFGSTGKNMLFITTTGEVFGVGRNDSACLGVGLKKEQKSPVRVAELCGQEIIDIAAGSSDHVIASTSDGKLYVWGYNGSYQLGNGTTSKSLSPQLCEALRGHKVRAVACGHEHSLVVTEKHEVFAWGSNDYGEAGPGDSYQTTPQCVTDLTDRRPVAVGCNRYSSFVLTADGEVYSWGRNDEGQLGIGSFGNETTPQRAGGGDLNINVKALACGRGHSLVVTSNGHVFAWGSGGRGQVGDGKRENVPTPTRVDTDNFRIVEVAASIFTDTSIARTACGKTFVWGDCKVECVLQPRVTLFKSLQEVALHMSNPAVTYKPMTYEEERPSGVRRCLREHFDAEEASDVDFLVEDEVVRGHVSFLRMRSPYLRSMLSPTWAKHQREIRVEGHSLGVFRAFLRFLYTDELHVGEESGVEEALGLLRLADEYREAELKTASEDLIRRLVSVDTVLEIYPNAIKYSAKNLEGFCLEFCCNNLSAVTTSAAYLTLDPDILRSLFLNAAKNQAFRH